MQSATQTHSIDLLKETLTDEELFFEIGTESLILVIEFT